MKVFFMNKTLGIKLQTDLINESTELMKIFGAILEKVNPKS